MNSWVERGEGPSLRQREVQAGPYEAPLRLDALGSASNKARDLGAALFVPRDGRIQLELDLAAAFDDLSDERAVASRLDSFISFNNKIRQYGRFCVLDGVGNDDTREEMFYILYGMGRGTSEIRSPDISEGEHMAMNRDILEMYVYCSYSHLFTESANDIVVLQKKSDDGRRKSSRVVHQTRGRCHHGKPSPS